MRQVFNKFKTPLTLVVLLVILFVGFWWGWGQVTAPVPTTPPDPCVTQTLKGGVLQANQVTVRVFNGGSVSGRAAKIGADLRSKGFIVAIITNTDEAVEKTVIAGSSSDNPEVKLVAAFFPESTIKADNRVDHSVDVVVGDDYRGFNAKAATSAKVAEGVACLPRKTPSATPTR